MVIVGVGRNADVGALAYVIGRHYGDEHDVVIDGERRNRSAPSPKQVILSPAFAIALQDEVGIVGHQIAVDHLQPSGN